MSSHDRGTSAPLDHRFTFKVAVAENIGFPWTTKEATCLVLLHVQHHRIFAKERNV